MTNSLQGLNLTFKHKEEGKAQRRSKTEDKSIGIMLSK